MSSMAAVGLAAKNATEALDAVLDSAEDRVQSEELLIDAVEKIRTLFKTGGAWAGDGVLEKWVKTRGAA